MTRKERIIEELKRRIIANNYDEFKITMKCNGDVLTLTPISRYGGELTDIADLAWISVHGSVNPWLGGEIEDVADNLDNYAEHLNDRLESIERLKKYIREHGCMDEKDPRYLSSWVSDWHKDLFGRRPHCSEEQIVAWANSDSTESALEF